MDIYSIRQESTEEGLGKQKVGKKSEFTRALSVEELVQLVEAEEDLSDVADEKDDDDPDEHEGDAAVPAAPKKSQNAWLHHCSALWKCGMELLNNTERPFFSPGQGMDKLSAKWTGLIRGYVLSLGKR